MESTPDSQEPLEFEMALAGASVTVAYYLQNQAALDAAGPVSIVDGVASIAAHFDELDADPEVTSITLSGVGGNVLTLTLAQALNDTHALAALASLAQPYSIAATSSAQSIEALTASQIAQLSASGVTQIKATDQDVDLTAAQKEALGAANLAIVEPFSGGSAEVFRYQSNGLLASVSYRGIVGLPYTDYTVSYGSDGKPASATYSNGMTASYTYLSNGSYDVLYAGVTGESYSAYVMHYGSNGEPITSFYDNGMMATWTYNQNGTHSIEYEGVTGQAYTSYTITYGTNGAPTSAVYNNGMTALWTYNADGTSQIDYFNVTGAAFTSYSQEDGANGTPTTATYSNGMQAIWTYLADGSHDVLYTNVTGQPYTAYEMHYGANGTPTTAFYNNGMMATWTYNADGSYAVEYDGVTGASYTSDTINYGEDGRAESATYNNGMTSTWTYAGDGARLVAYQGMNGSAGYTSHASVIDTSGQTVADAEDMNNGSGILRTFGNNLTISSSASGLNVMTAGRDTFGVNAHANETFAVSQANSEAFDFSSGFGAASISGFQIGGTGSDIIQFDLSMFNGLSSTNTSAQNLADLLASGAAMQSGQNVTISDLTGDVLTLKNVTTSLLGAAANSVLKFV